ncbi:uncharacterized protein LOC120086706 [Benincasa hispida]|uniref:uncharacterized protein LOC120086706 n=1 Tax=Benincasa hispida TaxID=102211 RepID=UPI001900519C|nr:uncharacterized protein LOC120086706 [Benincasa hispida]
MANFHKSKSDYDHHRRRNHCCKRHPKHHQSPGVCSLCLTEKLSRILSAATTTSSSRKTSDSLSSSYSSSYYSSASSSSSCSSPNLYHYNTDRRKTAFVFSASSIFKKSKSMAAIVPRLRGRTESESEKKSNLGFWSRFLNRPRRKRMEFQDVLMHSRTIVERNVHG